MPSEARYAQWRTDCPACGKSGSLIVVEVTLFDGTVFYPGAKLEADGFEVGAWKMLGSKYEKNESTEDEQVYCSACQNLLPLSDLATQQ